MEVRFICHLCAIYVRWRNKNVLFLNFYEVYIANEGYIFTSQTPLLIFLLQVVNALFYLNGVRDEIFC